MSRMFEDLKDSLKQEIRALSKKDMTKESLDMLYKLTESLKAVQTIEAMEKSEKGSSSEPGYSMNQGMVHMGSYNGGSYGSYDSYNQGGSNRGSYENNGNNRGSYRGGSYDGSYEGGSNRGSYDGSYERGGSNRGSYENYDGGSNARRGRDGDGDGRYAEASNRNYSRHTSKERMIQKLETMMEDASTSKEKEAIMRCMEQLES